MNDNLYRQQLIDHYKNPRNTGEISDATHKSRLANTSCGDEIEMFLKFENKKLTDIKYDARGCAVSIAAISLLSNEVKDMTQEEILNIDNSFIEELIGSSLTSSRVKCATLGLDSIKKAINEKSTK